MTTRTDILQIKLETDGEGKVKASLAGVGNEIDGVDRSTSNLNNSLGIAKVGIAAIAAGAAFLGAKIVSTTAEFEKLNIRLKTVTGSQEEASRAMAMIKELSTELPSSVQDITDSFIKLKALGLDPSRESIISYSNTAAAMGRDLNQMIEAVADASTGEFERLKEFGIKARSQGDQVSFIFQGVTTTVKNNSQAIQQYLLDIGNTKFANAATAQMDTLDGAFSNLGVSVDNLLVAMGEAGLAGTTKEAVQDLTRVLSDPKLIEAATAITSAIVDGLTFSGKAVATLALEFADLGDALGAYAAIAAEVATFDFDAAGAIVEMRKQERAEVEASINALWEKKKVSEQVAEALAQDQLTGKKPLETGGGNTQEQDTGTGNKNADKLIADLDRQIALYGEVGEAAQLRYDIESGRLGEVSEAQRSMLLARAEELEFLEAEKAAIAEAVGIQNEWNESRERERELLQQRFAVVEEAYLSEQERLRPHFEEQRLIVEEYFAGDLENEQQKNLLLEQIESEHLNRMLGLGVDFYQKQAQQDYSAATRKTQTFLGGMKSLTAGMAQHSRELFEINKIAAMSDAALNLPAAVSGAYRWGAQIGGPPAGAAAALIAGYAQAKQIQAISKTQFSGGGTGTTPSSAGSSPVINDFPAQTIAPPSQQPRSGGSTTFNLIGDENSSFTFNQVQAMLGGIRDAIANGDEVIIPSGSRQAQELQAA